MLYMLSSSTNTFRLIEFDFQSSTDYMAFQEGRSLLNEAVMLKYRIEKKAAFDKLKKSHFIESTGPQLVSSRLREALSEEESRGEVQFFEVDIESDHGHLNDVFAMNVTHRIACTDMARSEAKLSNFDPANPEYDFYYQVLLPEFDSPPDMRIAICDEMPRMAVVSEVLLSRFSQAKLNGLILYSALDMTTWDRSVCVKL